MLELLDVKKKYGDSAYIFDGINLKVDHMSIVELKGENGIGKSTLLNIIAGMTKFEGDVKLNEVSIVDHFKKYMEDVSLIGNTPFLYEYLTPYETIDLILSFLNKETLDPSLEKLIEKIRLDEYKDTLTRELSLGTRQKLSLILALLPSPNLILLDEPFVNLDVLSRDVVLDFLENYVTENNAILIYATHSTDTYLAGFPNRKLMLEKNEQHNKVVLVSD